MTTDPKGCVEHRDHRGGDETPGEKLKEHSDHGVTGGGLLEATANHCDKSGNFSSIRITISQCTLILGNIDDFCGVDVLCS